MTKLHRRDVADVLTYAAKLRRLFERSRDRDHAVDASLAINLTTAVGIADLVAMTHDVERQLSEIAQLLRISNRHADQTRLTLASDRDDAKVEASLLRTRHGQVEHFQSRVDQALTKLVDAIPPRIKTATTPPSEAGVSAAQIRPPRIVVTAQYLDPTHAQRIAVEINDMLANGLAEIVQ